MADTTPNKERLTEAQRKQNHIQSERQRREAVRHGFNQLSEIVPGMADQGRSEVRVLSATVDYIAAELAKKQQLQEQCMQRGMSEGDFEQIYRNEEKISEAKHAARSTSGSPAANGAGDEGKGEGKGSPSNNG